MEIKKTSYAMCVNDSGIKYRISVKTVNKFKFSFDAVKVRTSLLHMLCTNANAHHLFLVGFFILLFIELAYPYPYQLYAYILEKFNKKDCLRLLLQLVIFRNSNGFKNKFIELNIRLLAHN